MNTRPRPLFWRLLPAYVLLLLALVSSLAQATTFHIETFPALEGSGAVAPGPYTYAIEVLDHSNPVSGTPAAILGPPDFPGGSATTSTAVVDFNGYVVLDFGQTFQDGPGIDMVVVGASLDELEGWDLYVGSTSNPPDMTYVGTFDGSPLGAGQLNTFDPLVVEVDFDGTPLPANPRYVRMVAEYSGLPPYGFEYDAVGVSTGGGPVTSFEIASIEDVGNDQGRQVRVEWNRHDADAGGASPQVESYSVYRRIEPGLKRADWDFLVNLPATTADSYTTVVPTLCDSTEAGVCWSVFFVRAHTADPGTFFDSVPDSGYSVDNLAPAPPENLQVAYGASGNDLTWSTSLDPDFRYFKIYRATTASFDPTASNLVHATSATTWTDSSGGGNSHYKISAVDFAGNESDFSSPVVGTATWATPGRGRLLSIHPNPFNPRSTIQMQAPEDGSPVVLQIIDLRGKVVRTLVDGSLLAGRHAFTWSGRDERGEAVASGVYMVRLWQRDGVQTQRLTLLK